MLNASKVEADIMDSRLEGSKGCLSRGACCSHRYSLTASVLLVVVFMLSSCPVVETTFDTLSSTKATSKHGPTPTLTVDTSPPRDAVERRMFTGLYATATATITSLMTSPTLDPQLASTSTTLVPLKSAVTDDFVVIEMVRLVFQGNIQTPGLANQVYDLLESFLTRAAREMKAKDGYDWSYELSSTLRSMTFDNTSTYMDYRIKHTAPKEMLLVFNSLQLRSFISQNSNLVLVAECWPSKNCQNRSLSEIPQVSMNERNANLVTTVAVLCTLCLVVMVTGLLCSCIRRMDALKTIKAVKTKNIPHELQHTTTNQSSSNQVQISRGEPVHKIALNARPVDMGDDCNILHSTWVIPLDESPGKQETMVVATAHDTKL